MFYIEQEFVKRNLIRHGAVLTATALAYFAGGGWIGMLITFALCGCVALATYWSYIM